MQRIQTIYDLFAEEAYNNYIKCKIRQELTIDIPMPIYLQKWDSIRPIFSYLSSKGEIETFTIEFQEPVIIEPCEPPSFNYLFWIEPTEEKGYYLFKYVECGNVTPLDQLDIALDDTSKLNLDEPDMERLTKRLDNTYVFDGGQYKFMFVKAWQNGTQDWRLFGYDNKKLSAKSLSLTLKENKTGEYVRVVVSEKRRNVIFPQSFEDMEVLAYKDIDFVDIGTAREAHDTLIEKKHSGKDLMSLWETYSKIELEVAKEERDEMGDICYRFASRPINGIAKLKLDLNVSQKNMLKSLAAKNTQFEVVMDTDKPPIVTLLRLNSRTGEAEFEDELYHLPPSGKLRLSLLGSEIVDKRRTYAIKTLSKPRTFVQTNLLYAIENMAEHIIEKEKKHIPALSEKTRRFLQEKFGIERLTSNQEEAVEIALNCHGGIVVIQGPPGTGKTTVVSAICHRLLELESKKSRSDMSKVILASAFQNDTIEHLASKIYTHGLPTVKIGKRSKGVRAEDRYIDELSSHLKKEVEEHGGEQTLSLSSQLNNMAAVFEKEGNMLETIEQISDLIPDDSPIPDLDLDRLSEIKRGRRALEKKTSRMLDLIKKMPEDAESYNFNDGFAVAADLLVSDLPLTDEDNEILENAPEINPSPEYMQSYALLKAHLMEMREEIQNGAMQEMKDALLHWIVETAEKASKYEESNITNEDDFICSVLSGLRRDLDGNREFIRQALQEYGETVAATNQLAGSKEMKDFEHIKNVILEEAARSNPLDLIIPMVKAEERIILVGDQNQLPHLLETEIAERSLASITNLDEKKDKRRLYEKSLFGIIFENLKKGRNIRYITLQEQFRMHPTIGDFISSVFYKGQLRPGRPDLGTSKVHGLSLPWAKDKTMVFCNVDSSMPESRSGQSRSRKAEAEKIMAILDELKSDPAFEKLSVGIITFYAQQVNVLFEEAASHGYAKMTSEGYDIHPDYQTMDGEREKLRIGSVDAFQGKEFDVVILSTVRSNSFKREEGNEKKVFGFLTLKNRLNVAFSRAQKLLIVVGDANMFEDEFAKTHVSGLYEICSNITKKEPYGQRI